MRFHGVQFQLGLHALETGRAIWFQQLVWLKNMLFMDILLQLTACEHADSLYLKRSLKSHCSTNSGVQRLSTSRDIYVTYDELTINERQKNDGKFSAMSLWLSNC